MQYTEEQEIIFDFVENGSGNGIIDAVAGAGKTTTIIECANNLSPINSKLFCAFNTKIAGEIRTRFAQNATKNARTHTIHSLGLQILNTNAPFNYTVRQFKYSSLLKSDEIVHAFSAIYEDLFLLYPFPNHLTIAEIELLKNQYKRNFNTNLLRINQLYRNTLTENEIGKFNQLITHFGIFNESIIRSTNLKREIELYFEANLKLLEAGENQARIRHCVDFSDMLYLPYKWNLNPPFTADFVFVDECQDLSKSQLEIVMKYIHPEGRILSVGDPQQSIYGFTGADIESFKNLKSRTNAQLLTLTGCFRCPQAVVRLAQTIKNEIVAKKDEEGILDQLSLREIVKYAKPDDLILSRLNVDILNILIEFMELDQKVHIHEDQASEVINQFKNVFFDEERSMEILSDFDFSTLIKKVESRGNYFISNNSKKFINEDEREKNIQIERYELGTKINFITNRRKEWKNECRTIDAILEKMQDFFTPGEDGIELSTIHRAKGLERDRVFIINYDRLPFSRPGHQNWETVQEKNLQYVAITRAKEELYLVVAEPVPVHFKVASNVENTIVKNSNLLELGRTPLDLKRMDYVGERISLHHNNQVINIEIVNDKQHYSVRFALPPPPPVKIYIRSKPSGLLIFNSSMEVVGKTPLELDQKENIGKILTLDYNNQTKQVVVNSVDKTYFVEFTISPPKPPPPPSVYCKIVSRPVGLDVFDAKMNLLGKTDLSIDQKPHIGKEIFVKHKDLIKSIIINSNQTEYQILFERKNFNLLYILLFILFAAISFGFYSNFDFGSLKNFTKSTELADSIVVQRTDTIEIINPVAPVYINYDQTVANYLYTVGEKQEVVLKAYEELQNEYFFLINGKSNREIVSINSEIGIIWMDRIKSFNSQNNKDVTDDFGQSASDILYDFFGKLNNGDCNGASLLQQNPLWKGSNNFCNEVKFGKLNTIEIKQLKVLTNEQNVSSIYARYSAVENGIPKIYTQKIIVENKSFNGKNRWFITKLINIQPIFISDINFVPEKTIFYGTLEVRDTFFSVPFMILENGNYKDVPCQNKNNNFQQRIESVFGDKILYRATSQKDVIQIRPKGFKDLIPYGEEYSDEIRSVQAILPNSLDGVCSNDPSIGLINQEKKIFFDIFSLAEAREYPDYYKNGFLCTLDINNDGIKEYFYQLVNGDSCFFDWHYEVYSNVDGNWILLFKRGL